MNPDPLTKLYVEITTTCNLDCITCVRRAWNEPIGMMSLAMFEDLVGQIASFAPGATLHFGGYGEPLHHPDFLTMVRLAKEAGLRSEVTTNGMLLSPALAEALVALPLDRLVVSVDGVTPQHYADVRQLGDFEQVMGNLAHLRRVKLRRDGRHGPPRVGIAFVAMKQNVADLPALPWLATRIGAWEIIVSNLVPHSLEMEGEILYERALTACAYRASHWVADMSLPKLDLDDYTLPPLARAFTATASLSLLDASLSARNDYCRFAQQGYAAVRWDGEVSPCLSLLHDHPEYIHHRRKWVTHQSFGNIAERDFGAIWTSPPYTAFRARLREFHFSPCTTCGGCERFPYNYEDCIGNDHPTCGGCLWAQGFIQCP